MAKTTIYIDAATGRIISSVNGGRVSPADLPAFFENGNQTLVMRIRTVTNPGTAVAVLTPFVFGAGSAYQLSITEASDWSEATAPLIRVNNSANIYVSDAANAELTADWKNTTQEFRDYIENYAISGVADGGIEMVELTADPAPIADTIQDAGGISAGATQLTIADASSVKAGDRCLIDDANIETLIVIGVNFSTSVLTFVGNGTGNGTVYSHANAAAVVISSSEEKVLLQDNSILRNRRDLGGQAPAANDPGYYSAAEVDSKLNTKIAQDLASSYPEQATVLGTERVFMRDGSSSKQTTIDKIKTYFAGTFLGKLFSTYADKATLVDADSFITNDSAASDAPKRTTWANIKATLKTYFDSLYSTLIASPTVDHIVTTDASGQPIDSGKLFNDSGTTASDIWTASKVISYTSTAIGAAIILQGDWDASTNTPYITGTTTTGFAWRVSVNGATNLGGITNWKVGDLAVKTASSWLKIDNEDIAAVWGNISGTLSNQTDLQTALDAKADSSNNPANKLNATAAPAVTDDSSAGYSVGSRWIDVTADKAYTCVDSTAGAAVWIEGSGGGSATETTGTIAATATLNIVALDTATTTSSVEVEMRMYDATSGFELSKKTTVFESGNFSAPVGGSSYATSDFTFATDTSGTNIRLNITNNTANTVKYGYRLLNASTA